MKRKSLIFYNTIDFEKKKADKAKKPNEKPSKTDLTFEELLKKGPQYSLPKKIKRRNDNVLPSVALHLTTNCIAVFDVPRKEQE